MQAKLLRGSTRLGSFRRAPLVRTSRSKWGVRAFRTSRSSTPFDPVEFFNSRAPLLPELVEESIKIALETGTRGFTRSTQAAFAILRTLNDFNRSGASPPPPEKLLRSLFERLGATYIKLGQFIASSPTLFPPEYVLEFQKCLDKTTPVPYAVIRKRIEEELDQPIDGIFESIDPTPLACASIAQVHAATLKGSQKPVVIKVLKPGVEDLLTVDLNFLYLLSRYLEFLNPDLGRLSLAAIVSDIRKTIQDEVDFRKEAQHIAHFDLYLKQSGMDKFATCPFVYKQFSSEKVLTMERFFGAPLIDLEAVEKVTTANPEKVLISALNTWFGSVLQAETFHADVHAGNLIVRSDGKVAFIDFGIVGRINPVTWRAVESLLFSLGSEDYNLMARALATMGATSQEVNIVSLANDLEEVLRKVQEIDTQLVVSRGPNGASVTAEAILGDEEINQILIKIVQVGETHGIKFPREFGLLLKQILYFDRYVKILSPQLDILNDDRVNIRRSSLELGF